MERFKSYAETTCNKDGGRKRCIYLAEDSEGNVCCTRLLGRQRGFRRHISAKSVNCTGTKALHRIEAAIEYMSDTQEILERNSKKHKKGLWKFILSFCLTMIRRIVKVVKKLNNGK